MKKLAFIVLFLGLFLAQAMATGQIADKIIYNGETYSLFTNPLEPFFEQHPDLRPECTNTACWRGYVATFEIRDNQLVVKDVVIPHFDRADSSIFKGLFPEQEKVVVTWMSGILTLPCGELVNYVHMGYGSTYERYKLIQIDKGNLVQERDFTMQEYEDYRMAQYKAFQKTKKYKEAVKEFRQSEFYDEQMEKMLDDFIFSFYSSEFSNILIPFPKNKK